MGCWDSHCFICGLISNGEKINVFEEYEIKKLINYIRSLTLPKIPSDI